MESKQKVLWAGVLIVSLLSILIGNVMFGITHLGFIVMILNPGIVIGFGLFINGIFFADRRYGEHIFHIVLGLCVVIFAIIFILSAYIVMYEDAIGLPNRYNSAIDTINETKEYLLRYEDNQSLPYGLESWDLKAQLKDAIETKNELKASINTWLNNPYSNFKDIVKANLKYPI